MRAGRTVRGSDNLAKALGLVFGFCHHLVGLLATIAELREWGRGLTALRMESLQMRLNAVVAT